MVLPGLPVSSVPSPAASSFLYFFASSMLSVLAPAFSAFMAAICRALDATCLYSSSLNLFFTPSPGIYWMFAPVMLTSLRKSAGLSTPVLVSWSRNLPSSPNSTWLPRCSSVTRLSTALTNTAVQSARDTVVCFSINPANILSEMESLICVQA